MGIRSAKCLTVYASDESYLSDAMIFIQNSLATHKLPSKLKVRTELLCEEMIVSLVRHQRSHDKTGASADDGSFTESAAGEQSDSQSGSGAAGADDGITINIRKRSGDVCIELRSHGDEFVPFDAEGSKDTEPDIDRIVSDTSGEADTYEAEEAIRGFLLRAYGENFKYSHGNGVNRVRIMAGKGSGSMLKNTIIALALGLVTGALIAGLAPQSVSNAACEYVLTPIRTMFMNALRIIIGPVVFFSIATCLSQFSDLKELGRIGAKVMGMYLLTTVIAFLVGTGAFYLFTPGTFGGAPDGLVPGTVEIDTDTSVSLLDTIVNIVPSNFLAPFLNTDTLAIIFLALLCGIAIGMLGRYSKMLMEIFEAFNSLFLTITTLITRLIPVAVFSAVALMIIQSGREAFFNLMAITGVQILAVACMIIIYALLLLIFGRLNPFKFFKKISEGMLMSFTMCSSSAVMPLNMRICTDKLGISPKISNFSIPLGATVNMDGSCIFMCVMALFLARIFGVEVTPAMLFTMAAMIIMLSLGAPGVPGSAIVCLGVVVSAIGVPIESINLIVAVVPILDMFETMSNTTGDMAVTTVVARSEGLIDIEKYNS
ncbi:MAG: dicarboxylate/amino acid:cation symporter [Eubacterium sp.]|nr:dicarboxylate/amino acid:cation symporter [Eubacterium sp.]